jgi:hypothetical protein
MRTLGVVTPLHILLLSIIIAWEGGTKFAALKVPRQCPLVLLVKKQAGNKVKRWGDGKRTVKSM